MSPAPAAWRRLRLGAGEVPRNAPLRGAPAEAAPTAALFGSEPARCASGAAMRKAPASLGVRCCRLLWAVVARGEEAGVEARVSAVRPRSRWSLKMTC